MAICDDIARDQEIAHRYRPQILHCLAVAGSEICYLSVLFGNRRWESFEVPADEAFQANMIEREHEFWGYVETDEAPPRLKRGR